jgi:cobalamin biosynthesis protein CbiD
MILIFGGTTEGRKAVTVCDEAGKPYFYSTKSDTQDISCVHGKHITGGMDSEKIKTFCTENNISLVIDAAHPFAEELHKNISVVSEQLNIPVIRYERQYPEQDKSLLWFDTYADAIKYLKDNHINNLLALTGVNTLSKLKPYWKDNSCWFRILDRDESYAIVEKEGFPLDKIIYYKKGEDEASLFNTIKPQAIITKESGESGGFNEKVNAAKRLSIPLLVIKRPTLSDKFISVFGENGLRKQIENLLPGFFDLRTGYTTGTCATAAAKAALTTLLTGKTQEKITITLPNGEWVQIPIRATHINNDRVSSAIIKDAGDDPDITNGQEIIATVNLTNQHSGVRFLRGKGVGEVTLPGLGLKIGEPAINKTPRIMIKRELFKVMRHYQDRLPNQSLKTGIDVTISVPNGEELAAKTFNPKLGIIGGISIIGTSGIVNPFSSEAFICSIRKEMEVARAMGCKKVVINSGAKSEKFVKQQFPELPNQAFIHYGNFIGETIQIASELNFEEVIMGIMIGKAVKLAEGYLDTHSKKVVMNKDFLIQIANECKCSENTMNAVDSITMARQLWDIIPDEETHFFRTIINKCHETCSPLLPNGKVKIMLIDEEGNII